MERPVSSEIFLFEGFRFDRRGSLIRRVGGTEASVAISPRALDILGVLVARAGDVVSKDEISAAVWPGRTVESSNLTVQIAALRRVLDQGQSHTSCIQTIGGRGYRFVTPVTRVERQDRGGPPTMPPPRLSIVVLPLVNLSSDPEQEYFADGITDDLTTDLCRISGSFVIARNTAFTYKGKAVDAKQIGGELGVRYVLEGSVRRSGSRVRVNAQLVDAQTGAHLWAERFDRESGDLLQIQDEITGHIASRLRAELVEVESSRSLRERPNDPDAVDLAMQARALLNKPPSPEQNERARRLCERALALDPNNVDALASLAGSYVTSFHDLNIGDWSEWHRQATDAVNRALAIDPQNARVFLVKSRVLAYSDELEYRGQIEAAIDAVETAIALDPNLAAAYGWLARLYAKAGHPERTASAVEQAMRLSPRDSSMANWLYNIGTAQLQMGRYDLAIAMFRKSIAENPALTISWANLAAAYLGAGRELDAHNALVELRRLDPQPKPEQPDEQLQLMRVQLGLLRRGFWPYTVNGRDHRVFREALRAFQHAEDLPQTGIPDRDTLSRLGIGIRAGG